MLNPLRREVLRIKLHQLHRTDSQCSTVRISERIPTGKSPSTAVVLKSNLMFQMFDWEVGKPRYHKNRRRGHFLPGNRTRPELSRPPRGRGRRQRGGRRWGRRLRRRSSGKQEEDQDDRDGRCRRDGHRIPPLLHRRARPTRMDILGPHSQSSSISHCPKVRVYLVLFIWERL